MKQRPTLKDGEHSLVTQIENWATPVAAFGRGGAEDPAKKEARQRANGGGTSDLLIQAQQWPTPTALVSNDRETPESWEARRQRMLEKGYNANGMGTPLTIAAVKWPTPMTADDGDKVTPASHQGGLTIAARQWPTIASRDYRTPNAKPFSERGGGVKGEQLPNFVASHFSPQVLGMNSGETSSLPARKLRQRLNPVFVCLLMGWPWFWTRAEPTSFGALETALWRSRLDARLSSLLGGR